MGDMSFEGAIGGFVFACPTGSIKEAVWQHRAAAGDNVPGPARDRGAGLCLS
jgi:hypothetical protein